jgi:hypothetical protein
MNRKLFRVKFAVQPTYEHPRYHDYDLKLSVLFVWLYGRDEYDAAHRAFAILEQLPFKLIKPESQICVSDEHTEDTDFKKAGAAEASQVGVALKWIVVEAGKSPV